MAVLWSCSDGKSEQIHWNTKEVSDAKDAKYIKSEGGFIFKIFLFIYFFYANLSSKRRINEIWGLLQSGSSSTKTIRDAACFHQTYCDFCFYIRLAEFISFPSRTQSLVLILGHRSPAAPTSSGSRAQIKPDISTTKRAKHTQKKPTATLKVSLPLLKVRKRRDKVALGAQNPQQTTADVSLWSIPDQRSSSSSNTPEEQSSSTWPRISSQGCPYGVRTTKTRTCTEPKKKNNAQKGEASYRVI